MLAALRHSGRHEGLSVLAVALFFIIPAFFQSPFVYSVATQILIGITAAFSVYLMLRMDLLTFAVPAFMAVGGYTAAVAGLSGEITDLMALTALSFLVPFLMALPIGVMVLRLRGVYFVLVTFILAEIMQLLLFETPALTGGSNGLVGMPATTLFGFALESNRAVLCVATGLALTAALITAGVTLYYRQAFSAIEENELLAQSLGLVVWHPKTIGFAVAAGLAGLAGFSLVNMLLTAHPSSFSPISSMNYIAYAIVGGKASMLGPVVGATLLVWASNLFSISGEYSPALFGILVGVVVLIAKTGIVGAVEKLVRRLLSRPAPSATVQSAVAQSPAPLPPVAGQTLRVDGISQRFGGHTVFTDISLVLQPGEIVGVIGPNGAGKTTLINIICGKLTPSTGRILLGDRDITGRPLHEVSRLGVVRSFQQTKTFATATVRENVARAIRFSHNNPAAWDAAYGLLKEYSLAERLAEPSGSLPYGLQKILGLVMAYATRPNVLLLDEPAAGLEGRERYRIDDFIKRARADFGCSILIVEHDMDLVRRLCPSILVIDAGHVLAEGPPAEVLARKNVIDAYLGAIDEPEA